MTFKREDRYLVLRWSDLHAVMTNSDRDALEDIIDNVEEYRIKKGKTPDPKFVCIKDTYPEYEYVWKCIEERVTKKEQEQNDN